MNIQPVVSVSLTCLALALTTVAAAQQDKQIPQVTVQASHQHVTKKIVGRSYSGIPIELVQLTRHVGYGDLDLAATAGAAELKKRIEATAHEACKQLDNLYPLEFSDTSDRQCIRDAVDGAMKQANQAIAAAEKEHSTRSASAGAPSH